MFHKFYLKYSFEMYNVVNTKRKHFIILLYIDFSRLSFSYKINNFKHFTTSKLNFFISSLKKIGSVYNFFHFITFKKYDSNIEYFQVRPSILYKIILYITNDGRSESIFVYIWNIRLRHTSVDENSSFFGIDLLNFNGFPRLYYLLKIYHHLFPRKKIT